MAEETPSSPRSSQTVNHTTLKTVFNSRADPNCKSKTSRDTWYDCSFCDTKLKPRYNMLRHMRLKHDPVTKPFGCRFCVLRFEKADQLELHERLKHVEEKPKIMFCNVCGASGNHEQGMAQHKTDDHEEPSINAPDAIIEFKDADLTMFSIRQPLLESESLANKEIWYLCNFCDKELKRQKSMVRHIKFKHDQQILPFSCKFCAERFKTEEAFEHHLNEHHDDGAKTLTLLCDVCSLKCENKSGMVRHMIDDHITPQIVDRIQFKNKS